MCRGTDKDSSSGRNRNLVTRIRDNRHGTRRRTSVARKKIVPSIGSGKLERTPRCSEVSVPGVLAQLGQYLFNGSCLYGMIQRIRYGSLESLDVPSDSKQKGAVL